MAKVIEFYVRDLFPAKVKSVPRDRGGETLVKMNMQTIECIGPGLSRVLWPLSRQGRGLRPQTQA